MRKTITPTDAHTVNYTRGEEIFNAVSHGAGVLFAAAGCALVITFAALKRDPWSIVSCAIYGAALICLYLSSTLYHAASTPKYKAVLRILDHCAIYVLIAGTYTPYVLVTLRGPIGWGIFAFIWAAAIMGVLMDSINMRKFRVFTKICYVAMGWAIIFAIKPLMDSLALGGIVLLISGGLMYTGGIVFFAMKRIKYMHSIWHLFVLAGSILHFLSVLLYVI